MVIVLAFVVAAAVGLLSGGGDNGGSEIKPSGTFSPTQTERRDGTTGTAKATVNVRSDPGNEFQALGVLRKGTEVEIVAKSEDEEWLQIVYPPRSNLRGWVLAESLDFDADLATLAIATPEQIPVPIAPTSSVSTESPTTATPETTTTPTPSVTPLPGLPDLVISGTLISGGMLVVTVTNQGLGPLTQTAITVSVYDLAGSGVLGVGSSGTLTLDPGASIDVQTSYSISAEPAQLLLIADPEGTIPETDDTNNRLTLSISGGNSSPTESPTTPQPTP